MVGELVLIYQDHFRKESDSTVFSLIDYIPKMIDKDEIHALNSILEHDELKREVCNLSGDSSSSPDGLTGKFINLVGK